MTKLKIIREKGNGTYLDCYDEIENSFIEANKYELEIHRSSNNRLKRIVLKLIIRFKKIIRIIRSNSQSISFSMSMGGGLEILIPQIFQQNINYIYMFDAWPRIHSQIEKEAIALNIKAFFFSSKQVTDIFNTRRGPIAAYWIPEGIHLDDYYFEPLEKKTIDVLEFGRRYEPYHKAIKTCLSINKYEHIYEKIAGNVVFSQRKDFINGLARTKVSICIPSNITHPDRAEQISSLTLRYLQSMASKCLIVGLMPDEMRFLFNYVPIIEINETDPANQIVDILENYETYIPLIERNYVEVHKNHTWLNRIQQITKVIDNA